MSQGFTRMPQGFTRMSQGFHQNVTRFSPECHKVFTKMSQGFTRMSHGFHQNVTRLLPECYKTFTRMSQEFYQNVTKVSSKCHQNFSRNNCIFLYFFLSFYEQNLLNKQNIFLYRKVLFSNVSKTSTLLGKNNLITFSNKICQFFLIKYVQSLIHVPSFYYSSLMYKIE